MEIEGNIKAKKVDGKRRAFLLDSGDWVSVFYNDGTKAEFKETIDRLDMGDRALFDVTKNNKGFLNINAVEQVMQTELPDSGKESPPPQQRQPSPQDVRVPDIEKQTLIVAQNALTNAVVLVGHKLQHGLYPGKDLEISIGQWADNEVLRLRKTYTEDTLKYTGK